MTIKLKREGKSVRKEAAIFETLFKENYRKLCFFAFGYVGEHSVAEDIVHDCFEYLWKNRNRIEISEATVSYLYNSVKNASVNHLKHLDVVNKNENNVIETNYSNDEIDHIEREKKILTLISGIKTLSEQSRKVIEMKYLGSMTVKEIGSQLDISENTVKTTLSRALKRLREFSSNSWIKV